MKCLKIITFIVVGYILLQVIITIVLQVQSNKDNIKSIDNRLKEVEKLIFVEEE